MSDIDPCLIEFRQDGTGELLWKSVEPLPAENTVLHHRVGSGAVTDYEIVSYDTTYIGLVVEGASPGGGEVEVEGGLSSPRPIVFVREV